MVRVMGWDSVGGVMVRVIIRVMVRVIIRVMVRVMGWEG